MGDKQHWSLRRQSRRVFEGDRACRQARRNVLRRNSDSFWERKVAQQYGVATIEPATRVPPKITVFTLPFIAERLGRSVSTTYREVSANGIVTL